MNKAYEKDLRSEMRALDKDIEQLKHQVSMGKGGIKAVFVIGSVIALVLGGIKLFKIW